MQRYFIPESQFGADRVLITGDDAHHLLRVMRAESGDEVIVSDGKGKDALVRITVIGKNEAEGEIVDALPVSGEPAVDVWVAQSLPKGDKLETVIQKGTEVGALRFLPFLSERTVVQYDEKKEAKRLDRWREIAKEAAEQAHRSVIPEVEAPLSWKELLKLIPETDLALICYEKESGQQLRAVMSGTKERLSGKGKPRILIAIGPEGGFTEKEVAEAEAAGCRSVGLGSRILRTETAALVALACILYEFGEMGG
ncbi:16S rRNA (uracil(1498)-N(3))-methyltransferase [Gorillibacterium massiliense]|uniref:16S rRNA (uracil(1498)-N(3))-methyltransferase n=1 Tax=Gorillibacterium massiliense TaxID=1280390 RepID=UPI0005930427|nr:16S rRNA (uracil(1498)-N(3))-methyltransferase [Gorillibacterium massiliense]